MSFQRQPVSDRCAETPQGFPAAVLPSSYIAVEKAELRDDFAGMAARFASGAEVLVPPAYLEHARQLLALLKDLPRPLWISVYDSANGGANEMADWVASWLPPDVGVFFQDGVGVHARTPEVALAYADALRKKLGRDRVRIIVEAFRPVAGGFRPATADELRPQLAAYRGYQTYLFDGPHYVTPALVKALAR